MHKRIDLSLILCAFGLHDAIRAPERSVYGQRVLVRRCIRCSRIPAQAPARAKFQELVRPDSHYT